MNNTPTELAETMFTTLEGIEVRTADGRHELEGICVPYDVVTHKAGPHPEVFHRGAFATLVAAAVGKVRLTDHNHAPTRDRRPVGVMGAIEERAAGLWGRFRFYNTPEGRAAFENAAEGTYGGLSIGFKVLPGGERFADGVRHITSAWLDHVSLVDEPAYAGADVLAVRSAADEFGWLREPPRTIALDNLDRDPDTLGIVARWQHR